MSLWIVFATVALLIALSVLGTLVIAQSHDRQRLKVELAQTSRLHQEAVLSATQYQDRATAWRRTAVKSEARYQQLLTDVADERSDYRALVERLRDRVLPSIEGDIEDPPSVAASDARAAEAARERARSVDLLDRVPVPLLDDSATPPTRLTEGPDGGEDSD